MRQPVATADMSVWNYDMSLCPLQTKCLLLTVDGIAVIGQIADDDRRYIARGYIAWSPLPRRNKEIERERNLR
jgi:hypothetical protein